MTTQTYNIVVTGQYLEGTSREQAIARFAKAFNTPEAKVESIFNGQPKTIKSGLDANVAKDYLATLTKLGIDCRAESAAMGGDALATPTVSDTAPVEKAPGVEAEASVPVDAFTSAVYQPENPQGLLFKIEGKPDYSFLTVKIPANEALKVEASAMATMDTHIKMKTKMKGGLGRFLTGENLFINEFKADSIPGEIGIAPGTPGDMTHRYLDGDTIYLQNSAYVASTADVAVETKWQGLTKGFFSGENLFLIRCSGKGDLWFNTYGAIIEIDVNGGYVVDTGNIVAFTEGLEYKVSKVGGYKSLFFSGEGFVCRFSGSGKVWIQTRSANAFAHWAHFYRPVKKK